MKKQNKKQKISEWLYWTPRILSILFILFLALFSLDVFQPGLSAGEIALALLMHNIPVIVLALLLWVSWKHELVGAIIFFLAGLLYIAQITITSIINGFQWYYLSWSLTIAAPAIIVGFLWLINWKRKR